MQKVMVLSLLGLLASTASVDAVVLCAKQRGDGGFSTTVKLREACQPRETELDLTGLGLVEPPAPEISARVYNGTDIAVPSGSDVPLTFDSERWDTADLHDGSAPTRLTIPVAGTYHVSCHLSWKTHAGGTRLVSLTRNGDLVIATDNEQGDPVHHTEQSISTIWQFSASDYNRGARHTGQRRRHRDRRQSARAGEHSRMRRGADFLTRAWLIRSSGMTLGAGGAA